MSIDVLLDQHESHTIQRLPHLSEAFYDRAKNDPFAFVSGDPFKLTMLRELDTDGLADAQARHNNREIGEFAADLAYIGFMEGADDVKVNTMIARNALKERIENEDLKPSDWLASYSRLLDVVSLQAFDEYHRSKGTLNEAERKNALNVLETTAKQNIVLGANVLLQSQKALAELEGGGKVWQIKERSDLVGKMFELLSATNRRREIYEREEYDETVVLSTTEFQDAPVVVFEPNHNFDIMEVSASGEVENLTQCKAGESDKVYAAPITKVSGHSVGRFFRRPEPFIRALKLTVSNSPHMSERDFKDANETLDSLFVRDHRYVGEVVLIGASR